MWREHAIREQIERNRQAFLRRIGSPNNMQFYRVRTAHSANVEFITKTSSGFLRDVQLGIYSVEADFDFYKQAADGILTQDANSGVVLIAGDCAPVMLWDTSSMLHGILHIGLLGILNGTIRTINPLLTRYAVKTQQLHAYVGPSIAGENYDVMKSGLWLAIQDQIMANDSLKPLLEKHFDGKHFDLRGAAVDHLVSVGIQESNIEVFAQCTTDPQSQFFSHYAATQSGQHPQSFASVIWIP